MIVERRLDLMIMFHEQHGDGLQEQRNPKKRKEVTDQGGWIDSLLF
jgi:hypothetical protein